MQLQVNTSGAWRKVCEFPRSELALARFAGSMLACADIHAKFAILDDAGKRYYHEHAASDERWRTLKGADLKVSQ